MDEQGDKAVSSEVEERLDDIFGAEEDNPTATLNNGPLSEDSPLRNLKGIVLSIDWEITDDIMSSFLGEIEALRDRYADEKIPALFLQLLGSVGTYIRNQKARAHPDSIQVLNSVYNSFEKVLLSDPSMSEAEKRKWLYTEVNRFKKLKQDITREREAQHRPAVEHEVEPEPPVETATASGSATQQSALDLEGMPPHEAFAYALEEIKQVIKTEFQALRAELRLWRESR